MTGLRSWRPSRRCCWREVNHRIANSLQLIASLIELQARKVADADAREALRRAAERVEAVTLVHRPALH